MSAVAIVGCGERARTVWDGALLEDDLLDALEDERRVVGHGFWAGLGAGMGRGGRDGGPF